MRRLYWKIFLSFWLATILIIFTTAWVTREIAQSSSTPIHERLFMDSYANAAVATYESGQESALVKWLNKTGLDRDMQLYLLTSKGKIIGNHAPSESIQDVSNNLKHGRLDEGIFKSGHLIVSHEILSTSGTAYRLVAVSEMPLGHLIQIPWAGLSVRLIIAIFISGLICYLLSVYLTQPLHTLTLAARLLATGKLNTRVGRFLGHHKDEIADLSHEFNSMAEKLETLVYSKERLLQDISHELRSPLARLQIAIELGKQKSDSHAESEFKRMELECQRLNTLITEILEFARLDKCTSVTQKSLVNFPKLIAGIIDDANYEFGQDHLRVSTTEVQPCQAMVDERLIHRAVENILRNALHYSPPSEPIFVSLHWNGENHQIIIEIEDKGAGVPPDQLTKIFNPFYRVDTSREKKTGGYGLGLAIAQKAIKLHHGEISAKNRDGGGLLVRIILPA